MCRIFTLIVTISRHKEVHVVLMLFKHILLDLCPKRWDLDVAHLIALEVGEGLAAELFHVPVCRSDNSLFSCESSLCLLDLSTEPFLVRLHGFNTSVHFAKF
jgi:hypothetical protein